MAEYIYIYVGRGREEGETEVGLEETSFRELLASVEAK